jgi:hypothetical protein
MVGFSYQLTDIRPHDGGFAVVPGAARALPPPLTPLPAALQSTTPCSPCCDQELLACMRISHHYTIAL